MIIRRQVCYFVTICVHDRECLFGGITNEKMILNDAGKIADECWMDIPKHFQNDVLHEYIVGAEYFLPLQEHNESPGNEFQKMIPRSIGSIVKGFKIVIKKMVSFKL